VSAFYIKDGSWWSLLLIAAPVGFWFWLNRSDVLKHLRDWLKDLRWRILRR
jgi:hypothetical protein